MGKKVPKTVFFSKPLHPKIIEKYILFELVKLIITSANVQFFSEPCNLFVAKSSGNVVFERDTGVKRIQRKILDVETLKTKVPNKMCHL